MSQQPTVLITGCSQGGLGDAFARAFAARGHRVFAAVRDVAKAAHFAEVSDIEVVILDVTSSESIAALAADLGARLDGKLDILVNNAGCGAAGPLIDVTIEAAKRVYDVNVFGLLAMTQAFVPMLAAAHGRVLNVSSVGGILAIPWGGIYHSSKAAVTIMSETLRMELAPLGITVVTGMLGTIESKFHANDAWQGLPESSSYKKVEAQVAKTAVGEIGPKKEKADDFARRMVNDVLRGASGQVWRGAMAQTVRLVAYHAPTTLIDSMLLPGSGLDTMAKEAASKK